MKRRLFLTGDMGIGKSTAIAAALGAEGARLGGFLTTRTRDPEGHAVTFSLQSPDGAKQAVFLDFSRGKPEIFLDAFSSLGASLLTPGVCVLDEIGGIELLSPGFVRALEQLLESDSPIIGVVKGSAPGRALTDALGLTEEYQIAAQKLRKTLQNDPNSLLYHCGRFDEEALRLAQQWAKEYVHG